MNTLDGLYEFKVVPFGLCSARAMFQRLMDAVLFGLKWKTCLVYLDDVIGFLATFEEHLKRLLFVLQAIRFAGLTLKLEKCHFGFEELQFFSHVVSHDGVRLDPDKIAAILQGLVVRATLPAPLRLLPELYEGFCSCCLSTCQPHKRRRHVYVGRGAGSSIQQVTAAPTNPACTCSVR